MMINNWHKQPSKTRERLRKIFFKILQKTTACRTWVNGLIQELGREFAKSLIPHIAATNGSIQTFMELKNRRVCPYEFELEFCQNDCDVLEFTGFGVKKSSLAPVDDGIITVKMMKIRPRSSTGRAQHS